MGDIMEPLTKRALKAFTDEALEPLKWNATANGVDASYDRGYSKASVVSGLLTDLLRFAVEQGMPLGDTIGRALMNLESYGCDEAGKLLVVLRPAIDSQFLRNHADLLAGRYS